MSVLVVLNVYNSALRKSDPRPTHLGGENLSRWKFFKVFKGNGELLQWTTSGASSINFKPQI